MIKEILATALLTAGISNIGNVTVLYSKDINYNSYNYPYVETGYFENNLESQKSIYAKTQNPIKQVDGISQVNSFILKYDWWDSTSQETNITRLYKYTLIQNRAISIQAVRPHYEGTIYNYENYDSISRSYAVYAGLPTNQTIINALNGNFPTSYNNYENMITDVGIPNITWTNIQCETIQDIGNTYVINEPFTSLLYIVERLVIDYANTVNETTPKDLINYPTVCTYMITYEMTGQVTTEVVDVPGLLFEILGMPFAWISTAFNFTMFPGTPYAVNVSHIMIAVIIGGISIFIIKRILH